MSKLGKQFYKGPTTAVAKRLLGQNLVRIINGKRLSGRIIEVEAYLGAKDKACHTFGGRKTKRNEAMYLHAGHAYIYMIYGMYHCLNIVTRDAENPEAVLIRALEPVEGINAMAANRGTVDLKNIANGPGKLCSALKIDRRLNGISLQSDQIFIEKGSKISRNMISAAPRIGVHYAEEAALWPLRYYVNDSVFVSKR